MLAYNLDSKVHLHNEVRSQATIGESESDKEIDMRCKLSRRAGAGVFGCCRLKFVGSERGGSSVSINENPQCERCLTPRSKNTGIYQILSFKSDNGRDLYYVSKISDCHMTEDKIDGTTIALLCHHWISSMNGRGPKISGDPAHCT